MLIHPTRVRMRIMADHRVRMTFFFAVSVSEKFQRFVFISRHRVRMRIMADHRVRMTFFFAVSVSEKFQRFVFISRHRVELQTKEGSNNNKYVYTFLHTCICACVACLLARFVFTLRANPV